MCRLARHADSLRGLLAHRLAASASPPPPHAPPPPRHLHHLHLAASASLPPPRCLAASSSQPPPRRLRLAASSLPRPPVSPPPPHRLRLRLTASTSPPPPRCSAPVAVRSACCSCARSLLHCSARSSACLMLVYRARISCSSLASCSSCVLACLASRSLLYCTIVICLAFTCMVSACANLCQSSLLESIHMKWQRNNQYCTNTQVSFSWRGQAAALQVIFVISGTVAVGFDFYGNRTRR